MKVFGEVRERSKAPEFEAPSSSGEPVRLSDYTGKYLILYFYPKAFTAGCTKETILFRDHQDELTGLGADVLGVSRDPIGIQCEFANKYEVRFPIISDEDGAICRAYGVEGRFRPFPKRVTFLIDREGYIIGRFRHELRISKHVKDVAAALHELQRK